MCENFHIRNYCLLDSHQLSCSHDHEAEPSSKSLHDSSSSSNDEEDLPSPKKLKFDFKVSTAISYICQLAPLPGKFFPQKAIKLGVPKGPLFGELQSGKTVMLQDGRQVGLVLLVSRTMLVCYCLENECCKN